MIEHLDRAEARGFLAECKRVLRPGGILRLAVPDLRIAAARYLEDNDGDFFLSYMQFDLDKPRGLAARIHRMITGGRGHHWMYDKRSLPALVSGAGFTDIELLNDGETRIPEPGELNLAERAGDNVLLEARRP